MARRSLVPEPGIEPVPCIGKWILNLTMREVPLTLRSVMLITLLHKLLFHLYILPYPNFYSFSEPKQSPSGKYFLTSLVRSTHPRISPQSPVPTLCNNHHI